MSKAEVILEVIKNKEGGFTFHDKRPIPPDELQELYYATQRIFRNHTEEFSEADEDILFQIIKKDNEEIKTFQKCRISMDDYHMIIEKLKTAIKMWDINKQIQKELGLTE